MTLKLEPIVGPAFSATVTLADSVLGVALNGTGDVRAQEPLEGFLTALHVEASRLHVAEVKLDCRELQFMNSSCLKALVSWIAIVQESELSGQYKICFVSNPKLHWQRRSLNALRCFASDLVRIEV
jgi:hypothetical protein